MQTNTSIYPKHARRSLCAAVILAVVTLLVQSLSSCNKGTSHEPCHIVPLYSYLMRSIDSSDEQLRALDDSLHRAISDFFAFEGIDTVTPYAMRWWAQTPPARVFSPDVDSIYADLSGLERSLGEILGNASDHGLDLPRRRYAAIVIGKPGTTMFATDSTFCIALNHYLGENYRGYMGFDAYQRVTKTPAMLPYDIAEALVALRYHAPDSCRHDNVASRLLREGALIEAKMRLVSDADAAHALGYLPEQYEWLEQHEAELWRAMVCRKLVYSTNPRIISSLFAPGPFTRELSEYTPGRAGRYIGYKIVKAYLKSHPEATLLDVLTPAFYADAAKVIGEADYQP